MERVEDKTRGSDVEATRLDDLVSGPLNRKRGLSGKEYMYNSVSEAFCIMLHLKERYSMVGTT